jgi:dTDP-4-amino-4,6-dideoxygalactose transaminase
MVVVDPQRVFPTLKNQGVPILRWDQLTAGVDDSVCPVSVKFSRGLLQFPIHEELTTEEMEWMIEQIRSVLSS